LAVYFLDQFIFLPFTNLALLRHFEKVKGYIISATPASKILRVAQWKIPHEGVFMCIFHVCFWYLP